MQDVTFARALGWASLLIAATEIFGQGRVEHDLLGIKDHPTLLKALGLREAAAGATILSQTTLTPLLAAGVWARVAGDAMDLGLLAAAVPSNRKPGALTASTMMVLGITALDVLCAVRVQRALKQPALKPFRVTKRAPAFVD